MLNFKSPDCGRRDHHVGGHVDCRAAGQPGRKTVYQPKSVASEGVSGSYSEFRAFAPDVSNPGTHGLSAPRSHANAAVRHGSTDSLPKLAVTFSLWRLPAP
jgi:hypothetical protein